MTGPTDSASLLSEASLKPPAADPAWSESSDSVSGSAECMPWELLLLSVSAFKRPAWQTHSELENEEYCCTGLMSACRAAEMCVVVLSSGLLYHTPQLH